MAEALDVREHLPTEKKEVEEEEESYDDWDDTWEIYEATDDRAIETPGETFRSPMGRKERIIVTRDKQRIKERILYHVLDGFNPDAGPTSRAFLDVCEIRSNLESGKVLGIKYAGMDVIVTKRAGKRFRETKNDNVRSSEEFKRFEDRVETMKGKFAENTSSGVTRSIISEVVDLGRPQWDTVLTVEARSREELDDTLGDVRRNLQGNLEEEIFSEQEKRELGGLFNVTNNRVGENEVENKQAQIEAFEKEIESYSGKVLREENELKRQTFEEAINYCKMESDLLRMELGQAPLHEITKELISNEAREEPKTWRDKVMSVLRKMLRWGPGVVLVGTLVVAVFQTLSYFHHGAKQAAHGVGEVARSIGGITKRAGPVLVPVLAATAAAVGVTATAVSFVASNATWLVPLFIIVVILWVALRRRRKEN